MTLDTNTFTADNMFLTHFQTDGTVNIVGEDLKLTQGAVSKAIYRAAGSQLQELVTAKNTSATIGDVIVTDGCDLKSKEVIHAVAPHWDKGKGTANKVQSSF